MPTILALLLLQGRAARLDKRHLPDRQLPDGGEEGRAYRSPCVPGWLGVRAACTAQQHSA